MRKVSDLPFTTTHFQQKKHQNNLKTPNKENGLSLVSTMATSADKNDTTNKQHWCDTLLLYKANISVLYKGKGHKPLQLLPSQ